jgi:hypothetical protein
MAMRPPENEIENTNRNNVLEEWELAITLPSLDHKTHLRAWSLIPDPSQHQEKGQKMKI